MSGRSQADVPAAGAGSGRGSRQVGPSWRVALGRLGEYFGRHQSLSIVLGLAVVAALLPQIILLPPFNGFGTQRDFVGGFADAGVFVLLAIGLNVVVGFAGLLAIVFITLKLLHKITWSWWWVLSPLWIGAAFAVLVLLVILLAALVSTRGGKTRRYGR